MTCRSVVSAFEAVLMDKERTLPYAKDEIFGTVHCQQLYFK
jgi:hypothetical protein